jgi:hypothetical protein
MTTNQTKAPNLDALRTMVETRHARLVEMSQEDSSDLGYAIKCGAMCIQVGNGTASATTVEHATRYHSRAQAARIAATIRNGANEKGRVVTFQEALADEIAGAVAALEALRNAAANV